MDIQKGQIFDIKIQYEDDEFNYTRYFLYDKQNGEIIDDLVNGKYIPYSYDHYRVGKYDIRILNKEDERLTFFWN